MAFDMGYMVRALGASISIFQDVFVLVQVLYIGITGLDTTSRILHHIPNFFKINGIGRGDFF